MQNNLEMILAATGHTTQTFTDRVAEVRELIAAGQTPAAALAMIRQTTRLSDAAWQAVVDAVNASKQNELTHARQDAARARLAYEAMKDNGFYPSYMLRDALSDVRELDAAADALQAELAAA